MDAISTSSNKRKLLSGREITEISVPKVLEITTKCPEKWVSFDLETGEMWAGDKNGWKKASLQQIKEVLKIIDNMR